jgi:hypothetical protein
VEPAPAKDAPRACATEIDPLLAGMRRAVVIANAE